MSKDNRQVKRLRRYLFGQSPAPDNSMRPVAAGFDSYGYPIVRERSLPPPYHACSATRPGSILPMSFADSDPSPPVIPSTISSDGYRVKPNPSVPAAPSTVHARYKLCIQSGDAGYFFRFRDPSNPLHGAAAIVTSVFADDVNGGTLCTVEIPGSTGTTLAPLCEELGSDKPSLLPECCLRILDNGAGQLICAGSPYDMLIVEVIELGDGDGILFADVSHPDLPGARASVPVCRDVDETPAYTRCCIDEDTGDIVCAIGDSIESPISSMTRIPLEYLEFVERSDGSKVARIKCGDVAGIDMAGISRSDDLYKMSKICRMLGGYVFDVCSSSMDHSHLPATPIPTPDICCYDPLTGTLVCEGTQYHGLEVEVVTQAKVGGVDIVSVRHDSIPGGAARVPLCPEDPRAPVVPPAGCCVVDDGERLTLSCIPGDHPWNGRDVTDYGRCIEGASGVSCILVWPSLSGDREVEMPVCFVADGDEVLPASISHHYKPYFDGGEEGQRCKELWDLMLSEHAKMSVCESEWTETAWRLRCGHVLPTPGRRGISLDKNFDKVSYGSKFPGALGKG